MKAAMRAEWVVERAAVPLWTHIELYKVFHDKAYIAEFDKEWKDKGGFKQAKVCVLSCCKRPVSPTNRPQMSHTNIDVPPSDICPV